MANAKFIQPVRRLRGEPRLPGDKSVSHRAAILGTLAEGETRVSNFLLAQDCLNTVAACRELGARIDQKGADLVIHGRGPAGLAAPQRVIDCGNSGTGVRLLAGVLAGQRFESVLTGDEQVRRRPMRRIIEPLTRMGASIDSEPGQLCPLRLHGRPLAGIDYPSPVASAQVKSCLLLAGLFASGQTTVRLPAASRDHTERMLRHFGAQVEQGTRESSGGHWSASEGEWVTIQGGRSLRGCDISVPVDISSAAFFLVAAALVPDSELLLKNVGVNPTRTGVLEVLERMGAGIRLESGRDAGGEPVADLAIRNTGRLRGRSISGADLIPRLIDELPILAVAAAMAEGETVIEDAAELRVKETDRISVLAGELRKIGVRVEERSDGLAIRGGEIRGGTADSHGDHRLAMSLAVAGLVSGEGVRIERPECVDTSFPGFWELLAEVSA
ncbi:MAG: 3-phosphoshikimate 1-carboxyvinyltransferase [candidate division FCPU426 bacterium]